MGQTFRERICAGLWNHSQQVCAALHGRLALMDAD